MHLARYETYHPPIHSFTGAGCVAANLLTSQEAGEDGVWSLKVVAIGPRMTERTRFAAWHPRCRATLSCVHSTYHCRVRVRCVYVRVLYVCHCVMGVEHYVGEGACHVMRLPETSGGICCRNISGKKTGGAPVRQRLTLSFTFPQSRLFNLKSTCPQCWRRGDRNSSRWLIRGTYVRSVSCFSPFPNSRFSLLFFYLSIFLPSSEPNRDGTRPRHE